MDAKHKAWLGARKVTSIAQLVVFQALGVIVPATLVGKNLILAQKDQTRKTPPADTRGNLLGGNFAPNRFTVICGLGRGASPTADKEVELPSSGRNAPMPSHLRVYHGPQEDSPSIRLAQHQRETIGVPLMEVLPLLADAVQSERTWLQDFADDEITISMDLYEVLLAYQHYRRPSA